MKIISPSSDKSPKENIVFRTDKQNISNKKIYFDSDGTEIKIGYDEKTGIGFVEIIDNQ